MSTGKILRISQVGLRGVVGRGLSASHVMDFASAFGTFLEPGRPVVVGRDPRASGCMIREGVVSALMAGCTLGVAEARSVFTSAEDRALRGRNLSAA